MRVEKFVDGLHPQIKHWVEMVELTTFEKALELALKRERSLGLGPSETLDHIGMNRMSIAKGVPIHHKRSYQPKGLNQRRGKGEVRRRIVH